MQMNPRSLIIVIGAVACSAAIFGCSPQRAQRADRAIASGTVTYKGKPLGGGIITFAASGTSNTSSGMLKADGTYYIEDVPVGENNITIDPETIKPNLGSRYVQIPAKYLQATTSGLTSKIELGENTADFNLE